MTPDPGLEARMLYSIIVAGKSASFADKAIRRLLGAGVFTPFEWVREARKAGTLRRQIREARTGNYTKLERALSELVDAKLDLATCDPEALEKIHGIGPKTSRFFIMWTRPESESRYAALDTHVLKWLRYLGHAAPRCTPSKAKYPALERVFLAECDKRKMTARAVDSMIWDWCSRRLNINDEWPEELRPIPQSYAEPRAVHSCNAMTHPQTACDGARRPNQAQGVTR